MCIGEQLDALEVYIFVGSKTYSFKNLTDAVDTLFKIGHLFGHRFLVAAKPIWQFFRSHIYDLPITGKTSKVTEDFILKISRVFEPKRKANKQPAKRPSKK